MISQNYNHKNNSQPVINKIIFDYAGVITPTESHRIFAEKYHKTLGLTIDQLHDLMRTNWELAKINKMTADDYWKNISKLLNWPINLLTERVIETFPNNISILKIIENLSQKYTTILMSNQIEGWIEKSFYPKFIKNYFSESFNSYQTGLSKPNPEAFLQLIKKVGGHSSEYLFIDDQKKNINAAKKIGMNTLLFTSNTNLLDELSNFGINYNDKVKSSQ